MVGAQRREKITQPPKRRQSLKKAQVTSTRRAMGFRLFGHQFWFRRSGFDTLIGLVIIANAQPSAPGKRELFPIPGARWDRRLVQGRPKRRTHPDSNGPKPATRREHCNEGAFGGHDLASLFYFILLVVHQPFVLFGPPAIWEGVLDEKKHSPSQPRRLSGRRQRRSAWKLTSMRLYLWAATPSAPLGRDIGRGALILFSASPRTSMFPRISVSVPCLLFSGSGWEMWIFPIPASLPTCLPAYLRTCLPAYLVHILAIGPLDILDVPPHPSSTRPWLPWPIRSILRCLRMLPEPRSAQKTPDIAMLA